MSTVTFLFHRSDTVVKSLWSMRSASLLAWGWHWLMIGLPVREWARCKRWIYSVSWWQGTYGGSRACRWLLFLSAPHPVRLSKIYLRTSGAPHPPQGGRCGDTSRSLAVKLKERWSRVVWVYQRQMSHFGVCPFEIYVHYDWVTGLALFVLKRWRVRLRLSIRHTCCDNFIFSPFDVAPVQLLFIVRVLILQNNVL